MHNYALPLVIGYLLLPNKEDKHVLHAPFQILVGTIQKELHHRATWNMDNKKPLMYSDDSLWTKIKKRYSELATGLMLNAMDEEKILRIRYEDWTPSEPPWILSIRYGLTRDSSRE